MLWNNQTTKRNRCSISEVEGISTALNRTQFETRRLHRRSPSFPSIGFWLDGPSILDG
jgi:hypothetical protein